MDDPDPDQELDDLIIQAEQEQYAIGRRNEPHTYATAFEQSGGQASVKSNASNSLRIKSTCSAREPVRSQLHILGPLELDKLLRICEQKERLFERFLNTFLSTLHNEGIIAPDNGSLSARDFIAKRKSKRRCEEKVTIRYGGDILQLADIVRGTIPLLDIDCTYRAADALVRTAAKQNADAVLIVDFDDRFQEPLTGGYRDIQFVLKIDGFLCELQLTTESMLRAKNEPGGHQVYRRERYLAERMLLSAINDDLSDLNVVINYHQKLNRIDRAGTLASLKDLVNRFTDKMGYSALHFAMFHGNEDMVKTLIQLGSNCLAVSLLGELPATIGLRAEQWQLTMPILERSDEDLRNLAIEDATLAQKAAIAIQKLIALIQPKRHDDAPKYIVDLILDVGCSDNVAGYAGQMVLHSLAECGAVESISSLLVDCREEVDVPSARTGETPLDAAATKSRDWSEAAKALWAAGGSLNVVQYEGDIGKKSLDVFKGEPPEGAQHLLLENGDRANIPHSWQTHHLNLGDIKYETATKGTRRAFRDYLRQKECKIVSLRVGAIPLSLADAVCFELWAKKAGRTLHRDKKVILHPANRWNAQDFSEKWIQNIIGVVQNDPQYPVLRLNGFNERFLPEGDDIAADIAELTHHKTNQYLTKLNLEFLHISGWGMSRLKQFVSRQRHLQIVSFVGNAFNGNAAKDLVDALVGKENLYELNIDGATELAFDTEGKSQVSRLFASMKRNIDRVYSYNEAKIILPYADGSPRGHLKIQWSNNTVLSVRGVSPDCIIQFIRSIPYKNSVVGLRIENVHIDFADDDAPVSLLSHFSSMSALHLLGVVNPNRNLGLRLVRDVREATHEIASLRYLYLSGNHLQPNVENEIIGLCGHPALQVLDVSGSDGLQECSPRLSTAIIQSALQKCILGIGGGEVVVEWHSSDDNIHEETNTEGKQTTRKRKFTFRRKKSKNVNKNDTPSDSKPTVEDLPVNPRDGHTLHIVGIHAEMVAGVMTALPDADYLKKFAVKSVAASSDDSPSHGMSYLSAASDSILKCSRLVSIDFSHTQLSNEFCSGLSRFLSSCVNSLKHVNLAGCGAELTGLRILLPFFKNLQALESLRMESNLDEHDSNCVEFFKSDLVTALGNATFLNQLCVTHYPTHGNRIVLGFQRIENICETCANIFCSDTHTHQRFTFAIAGCPQLLMDSIATASLADYTFDMDADEPCDNDFSIDAFRKSVSVLDGPLSVSDIACGKSSLWSLSVSLTGQYADIGNLTPLMVSYKESLTVLHLYDINSHCKLSNFRTFCDALTMCTKLKSLCLEELRVESIDGPVFAAALTKLTELQELVCIGCPIEFLFGIVPMLVCLQHLKVIVLDPTDGALGTTRIHFSEPELKKRKEAFERFKTTTANQVLLLPHLEEITLNIDSKIVPSSQNMPKFNTGRKMIDYVNSAMVNNQNSIEWGNGRRLHANTVNIVYMLLSVPLADTVSSLELGRTPITGSLGYVLATVLSQFQSLNSLCLSECSIDPAHMLFIVQQASKIKSLKRFLVDKQPMGLGAAVAWMLWKERESYHQGALDFCIEWAEKARDALLGRYADPWLQLALFTLDSCAQYMTKPGTDIVSSFLIGKTENSLRLLNREDNWRICSILRKTVSPDTDLATLRKLVQGAMSRKDCVVMRKIGSAPRVIHDAIAENLAVDLEYLSSAAGVACSAITRVDLRASVRLSSQELVDTLFAGLNRFDSLEYLDLRDNKFSTLAVENLAAGVSKLQYLQELLLSKPEDA